MKISPSENIEIFSFPKTNPRKNQNEMLKNHLPKFIFAKFNPAKIDQIR